MGLLQTCLTPQDRVFSTRFHYKTERKGGEFDICKVRLVVQGQHMKRRDADRVGDYDDAFSPVPAASGFRTILSLATQLDMFTDHVDISQAFVQCKLLPGTVTMETSIFPFQRVMKRILDKFIVS